MGFPLIQHDPLTDEHTEPLANLGDIFSDEEGCLWRYVKYVDVAITAGFVVEFTDTPWEVSADRAGGSSLGRRPAGVAGADAAADSFGYMQVAGAGRVPLLTDGGVAQADPLITHATTNGGVDTGVVGTNDALVFGLALVADTGTALAAGEYVLHGLV